MRFVERLGGLDRGGRPIRVGVIGAGQMGSGLVRQIALTPGLRVVGACDIVVERAAAAVLEAGLPSEMAGSAADVRRLGRQGRAAVTGRADVLIEAPEVDVVIDATGDPEAGTRLALAAIGRRKLFVTMNVEADATVGAALAWMARSAGVAYTVAAGDEPSVLCEMVDFARCLGFEVICAGKGKNNPLDRTATPRGIEAEAASRGMSPRMLTAFVDGTKTMMEMAALANATGLVPDCFGLHGPRADLADLLTVFVPEPDGGILRRRGVVDYAIGDVAPGVFLIVTTGSAAARRDLAYLRAGPGPYYLLHRPFHLASLEAPVSVARAALFGETTMAAEGAPMAECVAVAKRELRKGEVIDGIGGETVYGMADAADHAAATRATPLGTAGGARLVRDVPAGAVVTADDVALDERSAVVRLRRLQDAMVARGTLPRRRDAPVVAAAQAMGSSAPGGA